ncbi:putative SOS response-associated peptidase yoqW [Anaeromyxobacter sp. PSR-1]|nr:putative SOS response-associated peptidase yoqW [Anaeromyxobacter sp. PSR-1]
MVRRMCGRFTLTVADLAALAREWAAEVDAALAARWRPRFNVAPGDPHPVLRGRGGARRLEPAAFGLAGPGGKLLLNARVEGAADRPAFREAWAGRRAAVPADGFYEWEGPAADRRPSWLHPRAGGTLLLAALWGEAPGGGPAFAILTTAANAEVGRLHDRMPLLVPPALLDAWLAGPPPALPAPGDGVLAVRPVSPRVNSPANDDAACLAAPPAPRQRALF